MSHPDAATMLAVLFEIVVDPCATSDMRKNALKYPEGRRPLK